MAFKIGFFQAISTLPILRGLGLLFARIFGLILFPIVIVMIVALLILAFLLAMEEETEELLTENFKDN